MVLVIEQFGKPPKDVGGAGQGSSEPPASTVRLSEEDFLKTLQKLAEEAGGISEMARRLNIPYHNLYRTLKSGRMPDQDLLDAIGARAEQIYVLTMEGD